ncbi:sulfite exporter TauE/SafE family protein [Sphingobium sufflavum]|uniref:sulfite exporter TauE/SafE family protein n=1 Tax=Sphingobium sufflavum TaxID=1129547 RepID=UPI001F3D7650|nr:sulfite exporter TauE/SafE family protein [Sphingobium sufflavum]MCE7797301.1 sulfite exporter TauE/SafE family protein [Sphingobium sufflavum]
MTDPVLYYLCAIVAVILSGLAKGGFSGIGALSMPIMAMGIDPLHAAAILLPILIAQDAVGVWAFRHSWDRTVMVVMMPGMILGVALGYLYSTAVSESAILGTLGAISILFGLHRLWAERDGAVVLPSNSPKWIGTLLGTVSGFASQIAHAGAPPFQMWVLPRRLPRDTLVGTSAIAFAVMNWIKVPTYYALGQFTPASLKASLVLMPVAFLSTLAGVKLVRRVDGANFYRLIYALMVLLGGKLLVSALV